MRTLFIKSLFCVIFSLSWVWCQCDEGFIWIDDPPLNEYNWDGYNCFYESDLNVLSDFIQINSSLTGEHLEIGWQVWSNGRLESLTLYALQITSIPNNIGSLTNLNYLDLHFNQITSIPETIGELTQLTEIYLAVNQIGILPESIGNLSTLLTLNINDNQLTSIPESIGNLGSLEELLLFNNELTFLPESICNIFQNLSYYDFSANYICPPYPDCIENAGFQFTDDCPNCDDNEVELWGECYNIEETTFLQLSWNGLTGEIPPTIGNLTNLTKLWLYSNELIGEIPSTIESLTNLTEFYLWENQLTGEIPPEIGNLINLDGIDLHSNQFTGEVPSTVGNLTNLTYLNLSLNELTGEIPESICNLTIDFSIYNFHIEDNQFCPPYPSCIEEYVGYQDTSNCGQNNIEIVYQSDWNLVGLPLEVENSNYLTIFPDAIENTLFSFDDAYTPDSIIIEGEGYWLRFDSVGNTTIIGNTINELTVNLNEGWNLISGISTPLDITEIQDLDGIIIAGTVYGFALGGYSNTEILEPGKGYWVRANNSGYISLISNSEPLPEECYIVPEVGPCDGICPTYYYNQDSNECEEFITGCCGVEAFDTLEECINTCE